MVRVLVLDNYDSFTHNLVALLEHLGAACTVARSDEISLAQVRQAGASGVLVSPGPAGPEQAGVSIEVVRDLDPETPIFGVCLGHQVIAHAFGGRVVRADRLMHGKTSPVTHDGSAPFVGVPSPFEAMRYHSLVVEEASLPDCLRITARDDRGMIMALAHRTRPIVSVQFHPESFATPHGPAIVEAWVQGLASSGMRGAA